jgi:hypothetical protein
VIQGPGIVLFMGKEGQERSDSVLYGLLFYKDYILRLYHCVVSTLMSVIDSNNAFIIVVRYLHLVEIRIRIRVNFVHKHNYSRSCLPQLCPQRISCIVTNLPDVNISDSSIPRHHLLLNPVKVFTDPWSKKLIGFALVSAALHHEVVSFAAYFVIYGEGLLDASRISDLGQGE